MYYPFSPLILFLSYAAKPTWLRYKKKEYLPFFMQEVNIDTL